MLCVDLYMTGVPYASNNVYPTLKVPSGKSKTLSLLIYTRAKVFYQTSMQHFCASDVNVSSLLLRTGLVWGLIKAHFSGKA
jgi:hypothetical protein